MIHIDGCENKMESESERVGTKKRNREMRNDDLIGIDRRDEFFINRNFIGS